MSTALHPGRTKVRLNILMYQRGERWVGHCVELGILTSGPDESTVFEDARNICAAQLVHALENDGLDNLFRPPDAALFLKMLNARQEGSFEMEIQASYSDKATELPVEFERSYADAA